MMVVVPLLLALVVYGILEQRRHHANLEMIPVRVHVNGTRGKSSVTRLITSGLRAGGIRTFGKTTGTEARLLLTNGREIPVFRVGKPNIIEQIRVIRQAVRERAHALVIECMAVQPELLPVCEDKLVQSTIGVITNARADHLDVIGSTVEEVAECLAQTTPLGGVLLTAETVLHPIFERRAQARGSRFVVTDASGVSKHDLAGFSYIEHAENVALALAVCAELGVPRDQALLGMQRGTPDPGALRTYLVHEGHRQMEFVNAFAANDPDSTYKIWQRLGLDHAARPGHTRIVLVNAREDRPQRSEQLADLIAGPLAAEHYVISGQATEMLYRKALERGLPPERVTNLGGRDATTVYEHLLAMSEPSSVIFAIGNIVGFGDEIVLHFSNRDLRHAN